MPRKSRDEYDLRPNVNDKPNSQGTLFRAPASARTPESRQPRGYSPRRMSFVQSALGHSDIYQGNGGGNFQEARAHLSQSLARSDIPVDAIHGVHEWRLNSDLGEGTNGIQQDYVDTYGEDKSRIWLSPGSERDAGTVTHEVGHSESMRKGTSHYAFRTEEQQGKEEGFADKYARDRARKPGYKRREQYGPGEPASGHEVVAATNANSTFGKAYISKQFLHAENIARIEPREQGWQQDGLFEAHNPKYTYQHPHYEEGGPFGTWTPDRRMSKIPGK